MSTERTRQAVADYVAALQRGDLDALRAAFAPQATWTIRGDLPVSGTWTGADEILGGFLARVTATLDPETPVTQTLHRIIADGDYAVVFRVAAGLIDSVTEYTDTSYMKRVLFSQ